mmetsp:Transcript_60044/g.137638  ORF Transcript_60044/g.137638 Transcript_60044/m.137638 type:complete len:226 (-) Transcript_60044:57-734(-)
MAAMATGVRHILKSCIRSEGPGVSEDAVQAVRDCASEFISLVVSEARVHAAAAGQAEISESNMLWSLNSLGYKAFIEPLKQHVAVSHGGSGKRLLKRPRAEGGADAAGGAHAGDAYMSRKHVCSVEGCGKRFAAASKLRRHKATLHPGFVPSDLVEERPLACTHKGCSLRFTSEVNLRAHMRVHTSDRPFVCQYPGCKRRFDNEFGLKGHLRAHSTGTARFSQPV